MITEEKLYSEFEEYKQLTIQAYKEGKLENCFELMNLVCVLARQYYLVWTIPEFEDILLDISHKRIRGTVSIPSVQDKRRIVFYDTHATDNYVLTQQYLAAVLLWDVEVLFLTTKDMNQANRSLIKKMLDSCKNAKIQQIPEKLDVLKTAQYIVETVSDFNPTECIVHTQSYDLSGIIAFGSLDNIKKYYIETSDHIFWMGTKAFDYYIVFRSLGYNTCIQHRNISAEKILLQPYYPISYSKEFQGFPVGNQESIKILSGARLEKVYGANDKYFELIEGILKQNPNVEFYYIGAGVYGKLAQTAYLEKQIKTRNYGSRFHVLGFRKDITELMKHMDIYMGTYPIGGGLMTQIAASQGLPIVQFVSDGLSGSVGEFIDCENRNQDFVFRNEQKFYDEVLRLVNDPVYRKTKAEKLKNSVLTESEFQKQLSELLTTGRNIYHPDIYENDCSANRKNQIEVENFCSHDHSRIIIKSSYVRKKQPIKYLRNVVDFLFHVDKKWLVKKIMKG